MSNPTAQESNGNLWHSLDQGQVEAALTTSERGLTAADAAERLQHAGLNELPKAKPSSLFERFLKQLNSVLIYVLICAGVLSMALEHMIDAAVIFGVVLINGVIGVIQEGRAEKALSAIRSMIDPFASILRDNQRATIPAVEIVPGDIMLLEAGDRVTADVYLLSTKALRIDESALTGESIAVEKHTGQAPEDASIGDRRNMAYSGTLVVAGRGSGIVVATGSTTEIGRISGLLAAVEPLKTPLLRQIDRFANRFTGAIVTIATIAFCFAYFVNGLSAADSFMAVVGLAVAAIPEGLPAIMSVTLAIGVTRMARRNAIIRRLPAVETLGAVSVICTDKTGTLTRNEMMATTLQTAAGTFEVTGDGYEPTGSFTSGTETFDPNQDPSLRELIFTGLLCNDATLHNGEGAWRADGDPMEAALVSLAMKSGIDEKECRAASPRVDEIPFDADLRYMATLHAANGRTGVTYLKGAPEEVIAMCDIERRNNGTAAINAQAWHERALTMAQRGERVLALAVCEHETMPARLDPDRPVSNACIIGLIGFIDPPRAEAIDAIAACRHAGIRVVMITGDHAATAAEIGRQIGLSEEPTTMTGAALTALADADLPAAANNVDVFARTSPEHKLKLVGALQSEGRVVAMTGDGVNDAPALKRADVGVAMGRKGTEAAKEAAEMVLADDNFASIVAAVREGRTVYDNLMKVIAWTIPTNCGEALIILFALAFGMTLPMTPVQILWVNMVTAVTLGLSFGFDPTGPGTMRRPPRMPQRSILDRRLAMESLFVSILFLGCAIAVYYGVLMAGEPLQAARTAVVNTFVVMEIFYLISVRHPDGIPLTLRGLFGTRIAAAGIALVLVLQGFFTYAPWMHIAFGTAPLGARAIAGCVVAALMMLICVELAKRASVKRHDQTDPADQDRC